MAKININFYLSKYFDSDEEMSLARESIPFLVHCHIMDKLNENDDYDSSEAKSTKESMNKIVDDIREKYKNGLRAKRNSSLEKKLNVEMTNEIVTEMSENIAKINEKQGILTKILNIFKK